MINLFKRPWIFFLISAMVLVPGIISLVLFQLKPSIDFVGGSVLEIQYSGDQTPTTESLSELWGESYPVVSVQQTGDQQVVIKSPFVSEEQKQQALEQLQTTYGTVEQLRFETIGPTLSRELLIKTLTAIAIVSVIITGYVWYRFRELKYGVSAILAMFHDSMILLGAFSLLGHFRGVEVDTLFVTAVLTTLSFSVHDTIVVFDRIRELRPKFRRFDFPTVVNAAVVETLSRSINNSVTIIIMLLALYLLGGGPIKDFALALLIGAITGTYSSPFVAVPILLYWDRIENWRRSRKRAKASR